jgi:uncharacterized lipoprotein
MKPQVLSLSLTALACLLASCTGTPVCGNSHPYVGSASRAPLQAPAGVTLPKPDAAYAIPAASTKAGAVQAPAMGTAVAPCLVTPPSVLTKEDMNRAPTTVPKQAAPPIHGNPAPANPYPGPPLRAVAANRGME